MKYRVIKKFTDLQDNNYVYDPKDSNKNTYPREGYTPSEERIAELAGDKNKQGTPLIEIPTAADVVVDEEVDEEAEEKPRKRKKSEE